MTDPLARRTVRYGLAAAAVLTVLLAIHAAVTWYGHPVAGLLVDPGGVVSNYGLGGLDTDRHGLRFPDRILSVDGHELRWDGRKPPAAVWDRAVRSAASDGRSSVHATVLKDDGRRVEIELRIRPLSAFAWWTYAGSVVFAGILFIAAGLTALWVSPHSALARTFARVGVFTGLQCVLSFDLHTSRQLVPMFFAAFALMPLSWVMLALRLPDDAPILARAPWLERALDAIGALVLFALVGSYATGRETTGLQQTWTMAFGAAFVFFSVAYVVRFVRARDIRRVRLRALLISVVPPYVVAVGTLAFPETIPGLGPLTEAGSYAMLSLFPIATAYAFIRYDLWGSRALLSRLLTRIAVGAVVAGMAVGIGTAFAVELGAPFLQALLAAGFAAAFASIFVVVALAGVDRYVFASRTKYKPTVEQLSEELISITSPDEVARAIERTIRRWLPCEHVEFSPSTTGDMEEAGSGVRAWSASEALDQRTLPVEFGGTRVGTLTVGAKAGHALFTKDDIDLLRTIVNQGALALAHAFAYQELETRRREQAAAWRGERAALVETVAAEVAHEIRYPINFFRSFFSRREDVPLDTEDLEIGREEVDRLERLVAGLRRMASHTLARRRVPLADLCSRVEVLLRDALGQRRLERSDVDDAALSCDPDQVTQILVNLVANGLQAAGESGTVGIGWEPHGGGATLTVWDTGPGFEGDAAKLFAPWYTTKEKGTGLGLAITHRLVRAHGWNITAARKGSRTCFTIDIRASDILDANTNVTELGYAVRSAGSESTHRRRSA